MTPGDGIELDHPGAPQRGSAGMVERATGTASCRGKHSSDTASVPPEAPMAYLARLANSQTTSGSKAPLSPYDHSRRSRS